jgi:hypothetical protein
MTEDENFDDYNEELKALSGEIVERLDAESENFTKEEKTAIKLCNSSMNFWLKAGDMEKSLWEARNTLQILRNITEY